MTLIHILGLSCPLSLRIGSLVAQELGIPLYPYCAAPLLRLSSNLTSEDLLSLMQAILSRQKEAAQIANITQQCILDISPAVLEIYINKAFTDKVLSQDEYIHMLAENSSAEEDLDVTSHTFVLNISPLELYKTQSYKGLRLGLKDFEDLHRVFIAVALSRQYEIITCDSGEEAAAELIINSLRSKQI